MKIKLIAPHNQHEINSSSAEAFKIQRLSLPILAALTSSEHKVTIVDEAFCPDDINEDVNLVGITVLTDLVKRAYFLADQYRSRGVKVVLGGMHPTVLPMEALEHGDAVVTGEGEKIWPTVISDAASGKLKKIYRADEPTDLSHLPRPSRNLYAMPQNRGYTPLACTIETSRGCPYDCEFCSIKRVMGRGYRIRPVQDVIAEIDSIDIPNLFFVDDSFGLNRAYTKKLLREMIPLNRKWVGQGTVSLARDLELLHLMKSAGCKALLIGFESIQKDIQDSMQKISCSGIEYSEAINRFHDEGIAILGAFVFGLDHENRDIFDQTLEFIIRHRLDGAQLRTVTPYPGTSLYTRLLNEGRLIEPDWWLRGYSSADILYRPKGMTVDELRTGIEYVKRKTYSASSIIKRFFGMSPKKRTSLGSQLYFGFNLATRRRYLKELNHQS
jgi:radical SAM superfamily enzyme YgiQ (UPF0313 family)